jgi:hypothetical protein
MEPITIASLIGLGLAGGVGGFVAGRRASGQKPTPERPQESPPDPRVEQLDRENRMLRRLTGLEAPRMIGEGGLLGEHKQYFEDQLAELIASNSVKSAAFFGPDGLVIAGNDRRSEVQALAAVFSTVRTVKLEEGEAPRVVWSDQTGNRFEFHRVVPSSSRPIYLGVWTLSVKPPMSVLARIKYGCSGLQTVNEEPSKAGRPLRASGAPRSKLFESILQSVDVYTIGVIGLEGTVAHVESDTSSDVRSSLTHVLQSISRLGSYIDGVGDDTDRLLVELESGRVVGFHPLSTSDGRIALLYMELSAADEYPEDRMEKWVGQLAWRLPSMGVESDDEVETTANTAAGGAA